MNQAAFVEELAAELRLRGVPHDMGAVAAFVADAWPLIDDDPSAGRWAQEFAGEQALGSWPSRVFCPLA